MGYLHAKSAAILSGQLTPASFAVTTAEKDARLIVQAGARAKRTAGCGSGGRGTGSRGRRAEGTATRDMAAAYFASFEAEKPTD
ncbi:hypothetical protein ACRAWF_34350 [Streptomyces sp. L7]